MSSIANLGTTPAALPPVNVHPHGHKRGAHAQSIDSSSDTAAQIPAGTAQNLFGSLLQSLEQVIGVQLITPPTSTTPATGTAPASGTTAALAAAPATAAAEINAAKGAGAASSALLQNYRNNLSRIVPTSGSPISVDA